MAHRGADVSNWQPTIDAEAMAQGGIEFCWVLLTDGDGDRSKPYNLTNPYAPRQCTALRAAGIKVGAYQFFRPEETPSDQAGAFMTSYDACGPFDLPFVIDNETESALGWQHLSAAVQATLNLIEGALHHPGMTYENVNFYDNCPGIPFGRPMWLADPSHPDDPQRPCLVQQLAPGPCPGIQGVVDLDVFRGSEADWAKFTGSQAPAPIPEEPMNGLEAFSFKGRRHVLQLADSGVLYHKHQSETQAEPWTLPNPLGSGFKPGKLAVSVSDAQVDVDVERSADGHVEHLWSGDGLTFGSETLG